MSRKYMALKRKPPHSRDFSRVRLHDGSLAVTNDDTQIILSAEETAELSEFFYQEEFFRKYDPIYPKAFSLRGSFFIA